MIKTVSFAPPRGAGSRSSAKTSGAKVVPVEDLRPKNPRAASGRTLKAPAQTSLSFEFGADDEPENAPPPAAPKFAAPSPAPKVAAPQVAPAPKTAPAKAAAPQVAKRISTVAAPSSAAPVALKTARKAAVAPIKNSSEPASEFEAKAAAPAKAVAPAKSGEVKAKRARVPKDLAAQYGEKVVGRVVAPPVEAEVAKKRLSKVERQARRDLIKPSEDLMARLARASQISARKPKAEPRGKGWKFQCGRCGTTSYFETPGGICVCGTIAVKD